MVSITIGSGNKFVGYITVDDENNAYITNGPNSFKMNLTDCTNIWSVNVAELIACLGIEYPIIIYDVGVYTNRGDHI